MEKFSYANYLSSFPGNVRYAKQAISAAIRQAVHSLSSQVIADEYH